METLLHSVTSFWSEAEAIWKSGGWAMLAIAMIALVMFGVGMSIRIRLGRKGFHKVPERKWREWITQADQRHGPIGRLLDEVTRAQTVERCGQIFEQLQLREVEPFSRDLLVMKICVSAAPLVGLLGTVTGMLSTFGALASGSGGDQTMGMVAGGISEALITTETGLVIALPGLFFQYQLVRRHNHLKAFLAHLETVCTQAIYRGIRHPAHLATQRAARALIADRLRKAMKTPAFADSGSFKSTENTLQT